MMFRLPLTAVVAASTIVAASVALTAAPETHVGIITDTMCAASHAHMKMGEDAECVRACVGDGRTYKYALLTGGKVYPLSDQETPAALAGKKVRVTGRLYAKTGILRVDRIEPVREVAGSRR